MNLHNEPVHTCTFFPNILYFLFNFEILYCKLNKLNFVRKNNKSLCRTDSTSILTRNNGQNHEVSLQYKCKYIIIKKVHYSVNKVRRFHRCFIAFQKKKKI